MQLSICSLQDAFAVPLGVFLLLRVIRTDGTIIVYMGTARGSGTLELRRSIKFHGGVRALPRDQMPHSQDRVGTPRNRDSLRRHPELPHSVNSKHENLHADESSKCALSEIH